MRSRFATEVLLRSVHERDDTTLAFDHRIWVEVMGKSSTVARVRRARECSVSHRTRVRDVCYAA